MAQWYSKRTVDKLRTQLNGANATVCAQIDALDAAGKELAEEKVSRARYYQLWQEGQKKIADLETQLGLRKSNRDGYAMAQVHVKHTAARRAHEELHKVKAGENCPMLLQRAIGNAQGILATLIDAGREEGESYADPISLYPDAKISPAEEEYRRRHSSVCGY